MTQVRSSGGTQAPVATPVSPGHAKAASRPDRKIAVPKAAETHAIARATDPEHHHPGTKVTLGAEALQTLAATGDFIGKAVLAGAQDVADLAAGAAQAIGHGVVDAAEGLGHAVEAGIHGVGDGLSDAAKAAGRGVVHVENAMSDVWAVATQGASVATSLAATLGNDAEVAVTDLGTAATDVGAGAKVLLSGIGSVARSAAGYGTFIVKQGAKVLDELT